MKREREFDSTYSIDKTSGNIRGIGAENGQYAGKKVRKVVLGREGAGVGLNLVLRLRYEGHVVNG